MRGVVLLSWRHMLHSRAQTVILIACITVVVFLPVASQRMITRYGTQLRSRAEATPMLLGALGNRFDLTLQSLYFRAGDVEPVPWSAYVDVLAQRGGLAIPMHVRFTARDAPIVATTIEYFETRHLKISSGHVFAMLGDAVLGSAVAASLNLKPGDALFSDQKDIYDISKPPALKMHIVGVLERSNSPDDHAVFVDINTAWVLEGYTHGHDDPQSVTDPALLYGKTADRIVFSEALMQYNEITPDNVAMFHLHGDKSNLPLSSVLFFPRDEKSATLVKARINVQRVWQMLVPADVIADLMAVVFRIKTIFDALSAVLALSTAVLIGLVMLLSLRSRRGEMLTLHRIGCSRLTVVKLCSTELILIIVLSVLLAMTAVLMSEAILPDLLRVI